MGGRLSDVAKPTEYFRDLRDFPAYNRIRNQFFRTAGEHGGARARVA